MPGLTHTGTLAYNGIQFTGAHNITAELLPVFEDAGRSVKAHRVTITANTILAASPLDRSMETIRFKLMQSGKKLILNNNGIGNDLRVNIGTLRDIERGPHPEILSWEPIGDARAVAITWRVTTTIPPCKFKILAGMTSINWGITWSIDDQLDTTRSIAGHIEIANQGVGVDSADRYRNYFAPPTLKGFKREQTWSLSPNKTRLDFVIVDTQIPSPNPYPRNVKAIEATHRLSWRRSDAGKPRCVFSATISPRACLTGAAAWRIFTILASQRLQWARTRGREPFLVSMDLEEDLFGRPQRFQISYLLLHDMKDILGSFKRLPEDSGLWRPIGTDWSQWAVSLHDFDNRGSAGLLDIPSDDAIVDLCTTQRQITPNNVQKMCPPSQGQYRSAGEDPVINPYSNRVPPPEKSWNYYDGVVIPYRERPVTRQQHLQKPDDTEKGSYNFDEKGIPSGQLDYGYEPDVIPDTIQEGGASSYGVRFVGRAERVGHEIPRPRLVSVGDQKPTEIRSIFMPVLKAFAWDIPIYQARWVIDYFLPKSPGKVKAKGDP